MIKINIKTGNLIKLNSLKQNKIYLIIVNWNFVGWLVAILILY
jgi:hypothetical protein